MAKASFTNEQLCVAWNKQAKADPQGTRGNVVRDLMGQMGLDPADTEAYRKVYNNVTQRHKQLSNHPTKPIRFPELKQGPKGARRTVEQMDSLQALLDAAAPEDEGEAATE